MGHWESAGLPEDFDGTVRLFPLPNLVLFPHVIQALHIFEPRYCEMLSESLESDHLITMALLNSGWEPHYHNKPKLADVVCIGRIISHTPTDDGCHNILLAGIQRARIVEELVVTTRFRQARVELIPDIPLVHPERESEYRSALLKVFRALIPHDAANSKTFSDLLTHQLPLGMLTDIIGYAVSLPISVKQSLLGEADVLARYQTLMEHIGPLVKSTDVDDLPPQGKPQAETEKATFPPPFSDN